MQASALTIAHTSAIDQVGTLARDRGPVSQVGSSTRRAAYGEPSHAAVKGSLCSELSKRGAELCEFSVYGSAVVKEVETCSRRVLAFAAALLWNAC